MPDSDLCSPLPGMPAVHWWLINVIISAINSPTPLPSQCALQGPGNKRPNRYWSRELFSIRFRAWVTKIKLLSPGLVMEFVISINLDLLLLLDWFSESKYGEGTHWKGFRGDLLLITVYKMVYRWPKIISPSCWNS